MSATTPGTKLDPKHNSRAFLEGPHRAAARAQLKGIGYDDEALSKPIIGVASTWIETMPCTYHLRALSARVKEGIRAAGGTPMEFNTIAISDGITMGTPRHAHEPGLARGDRRLDRAGRQGPLLRRRRRAQRLRQDDPRHRDGARAPGPPERDALRRLDLARAPQRRGDHDHAGLRGGRRPRRRARSPTRSSRRSRRPPRRASAPAAASSPPTRWRWRSRCSASRRCATPASPPSTTPRRTSRTAPGSWSWTCSPAASARATSSPASRSRTRSPPSP